MLTQRSVAALLFAGGVLLAGCSSQESQSEAEAGVCESLQAVGSAVAQVKALNAQSSVDDAQAAQKALEDSLADLKSSAQDVEAADTAAVESGVDSIKKAIAGVSGSDSLSGAAESVKSSAAGLETAVDEMEDGLQCN